MSYYVCPVCKTKNEEQRNYCLGCGTWLLSDKFPAKKLRKKNGGRVGRVIGGIVVILAIIGVIAYVKGTDIANIQPAAVQQQTDGYARTNPADLGVPVSGKVTQFDLLTRENERDFGLSVSVNRVIRGDDMPVTIQGGTLKEGHEYLAAEVTVNIDSAGTTDAQASISRNMFSIVSASGKDYPMTVFIHDNSVDARLYAGAEHRGWLVYQVRKDDAAPLIAFARDDQGRGGFWFKTNK
ncbi:DUF4352 domain-containing protein [Paenibacillus abyssi]|uniref:DUF4352 domain-containing protein n=1 Tax=Paenibacillus abyssi TaxID=1340531 RepID=A0A917CKI6_9BACL|nr:DUF4352 domain-containing protein [Paenibacillus abyssi]GGF88538.1 hypothetical protein GCM10010916_02360 [Paenibacillus abyssi]